MYFACSNWGTCALETLSRVSAVCRTKIVPQILQKKAKNRTERGLRCQGCQRCHGLFFIVSIAERHTSFGMSANIGIGGLVNEDAFPPKSMRYKIPSTIAAVPINLIICIGVCCEDNL